MILLLKRADVPDFWQSVTGSMRWGEPPRDAAVREVLEETGISADRGLIDWQRSVSFEILEQFKHRYAPNTHRNLEHMFSLAVEPGRMVTVDPHEHGTFEWQRYPEAIDRVWSWSNRQAIELLADHYWK